MKGFVTVAYLPVAVLVLASTASPSCALSMSTASAPPLTLGSKALKHLVRQAAARNCNLDLGGIAWMEHINLVIGDKETAEYFYINFLGCTRDDSKSFHVNMGQQQFHLAETGELSQVIAGSLGIVVPSLDNIRQRVPDAQKVLHDTLFCVVEDSSSTMSVICPWGNLFHLYSVEESIQYPVGESAQKMAILHSPGGEYGSERMSVRGQPGIRYIEVACPPQKSAAVGSFYRKLLNCEVMEAEFAGNKCAVVCFGSGVHVVFVESYELSQVHVSRMAGVHLCIYVLGFRDLYVSLQSQGLIWTNPRFIHLDACDTWEQAFASRTLRFKDVICPHSGEKILELEHETRALSHGQFFKVPKYEPN